MKKIFITIILLFNLVVCWRDGRLQIDSGLSATGQNAQQVAGYLNSLNNGNIYTYNSSANLVFQHSGNGGMPSVVPFGSVSIPSTWNGSPTGSGFTGWLGALSSTFSSAITGFLGSIGGSGGGGEGSGEEYGLGDMGWEPMPDGFGYDPTDPNSVDNLMNDPNFNPWIVDTWDQWTYDNIGLLEDIYTGNYTVDCNGVQNGSAYFGDCGVCISGNTGIPDCITDTVRTDTVQATKIPCDSSAIERGEKITNIRDSIDHLADIMALKYNSYNADIESGAAITKTGSNYGTFGYNTGQTQSTPLPTYDPSVNIIGGIHTHNKSFSGKINISVSPSPKDFDHLINGQIENPNYFVDFVFSYDSSEYAIIIDDIVKATNFRDNVPINLGVNNENKWSSNFLLTDGNSLSNKWIFFVQHFFRDKNYPLDDAELYANVALLAINLDAGISFYKKVDGEFKRIGFEIEFDTNNKPTGIKMTICN